VGERRRLEWDLHNAAQQRLVSLALPLRLAREKLDTEPTETGRLLDRSREELDRALSELRDPACANSQIARQQSTAGSRSTPNRGRARSYAPDSHAPARSRPRPQRNASAPAE
jgi:Histidine kinase